MRVGFSGFPWILPSESRLFSGLLGLTGGTTFLERKERRNGAREGDGGGLVYKVSLTWNSDFRQDLVARVPSFRAPKQKASNFRPQSFLARTSCLHDIKCVMQY
jgi:hypothetical protein